MLQSGIVLEKKPRWKKLLKGNQTNYQLTSLEPAILDTPNYEYSASSPFSRSLRQNISVESTPKKQPTSLRGFIRGKSSSPYSPVTPITPFNDELLGSPKMQTSVALQDITSRDKGPKVKPFIFAQSHQITKNTPSAGTRCFICDDDLQTKLQNEKILDLRCGDFVHSECFHIQLDYEVNRLIHSKQFNANAGPSELVQQMFPICNGPKCKSTDAHNLIMPVDESLVDNLIVNALLAYQEYSSKSKNNNLTALGLTLKGSRNTDSVSSNLSITSTGKKLPESILGHRGRISGLSYIRESSLFSRSPSPSMSISTFNTASLKIPIHKSVPIDTLKNNFIRYLVENCPNLNLSTLLQQGPLRLVDNLLVSLSEQSPFMPKICYLFTNYLLIWSKDEVEPIFFPIQSDILRIQTPKPSVLKLIAEVDPFRNETLCLNSDIDSIVEKWVVATSDLLFNFPSEVFTSTVVLPAYHKSSDVSPFISPCTNGSFKHTKSKSDSTINLEPPQGVRMPSAPSDPSGNPLHYACNESMSIHNDNPPPFSSPTANYSLYTTGFPNTHSDVVDLPQRVLKDNLLGHYNFSGKFSYNEDSDDDSNKNQGQDSDDSDEDSDIELIRDALCDNSNNTHNSDWESLLADIDKALVSGFDA